MLFKRPAQHIRRHAIIPDILKFDLHACYLQRPERGTTTVTIFQAIESYCHGGTSRLSADYTRQLPDAMSSLPTSLATSDGLHSNDLQG
jgi:hypothetical protein